MPIEEINLKNYIKPYFFETGTYNGDGVQGAINAGFEKIVSIEVSQPHHERCVNRFKEHKNVTIYLGDVELVMDNILKEINSEVTFWLDAHYSGPGTGKGMRLDPIVEELEIIKNHNIKSHTILIDDMRLMKDKELLMKKVKEINSNYVISFENGFCKNDILVAQITPL